MKTKKQISQEDFDRILRDFVVEEADTLITSVPGVYEAVSEYFNNAVIERWEEENGIEEVSQ